MPNSLTRQASLRIGPLFLGTLVKHYFDRLKKDANRSGIALRNEELLYDEAFSIVKASGSLQCVLPIHSRDKGRVAIVLLCRHELHDLT